MKRIISTVALLALMLSLTACAQGQKAMDVITQAQKASQSVTNMKANVDMTMTLPANLVSKGKTGTKTIHSKIKTEYTNKPLTLHLNSSTKVNGKDVNNEMYLTKDTIYMRAPFPNSNAKQQPWMKLANKQGDLLLNQQKPADPAKQLSKLKKYASQMSMKQINDTYVLKFSGKGDKINQFIKDNVQKQLPNMSKQMKSQLKNINYKNISYVYVIDKKTYYPKELKIDMSYSVKDSGTGKTEDITMNIDSIYSDINKTTVTVPQSIINNAKSINPVTPSKQNGQ